MASSPFIIAPLAGAILLAGCGNDPIETRPAGSNGAKAELIAEVDGCRIWRIEDRYTVFLARCPNGAASTSMNWTQHNGKAGSMPRHVQMIGDAS